MSDIPDPYKDDAAWNPADTVTGDQDEPPSDSLAAFDAITYYELLGLDRLEEPTKDEIKDAFSTKLRESPDESEKSSAKNQVSTLLEARRMLVNHQATYDRMVQDLGPRLGHQAFTQWRILGKPSDLEKVMQKYNPENQTFTDEFSF